MLFIISPLGFLLPSVLAGVLGMIWYATRVRFPCYKSSETNKADNARNYIAENDDFYID